MTCRLAGGLALVVAVFAPAPVLAQTVAAALRGEPTALLGVMGILGSCEAMP